MKKITHIGMAALVAMGVIGAACSKIESPEIETPETQKENIVTLTTTVGFAADGTKALTGTGVKTFAAGETMALVYKNTGGSTVKVVSAALTDGDITGEGKSATFTFELTDPDKTKEVTYIYPAAMANADGTVNYSALNSQDGTLTTLSSNLDYCTKSGAWNGDNLPTLTLENQLAILAITLKNSDGSSDITGTITGMTLSDGEQSCTVTRSAASGPIYVAIPPISNKDIEITATSDGKGYYKTLTTKTYEAGNGYPVSWRMHEVTLADVFTEGAKVNVKVNTANSCWFNAAGTYSSGSYTGVTQTNNVGNEGYNKGISMTKDGNNLVVWMKNSFNEITITFNTTNNTYTVTAEENEYPYRMTTFNSITINGVDITSLLSEYVPPMETITFSGDGYDIEFTGTHFKVTVRNVSDGSVHVNNSKNMVISATDGKTITKVVFSYEWKANLGNLAFSSGTFDGNATVNNVNASTLTVTSSSPAGTRYKGVTIYYE
ncbi:MAG: hypothetical protein II454_07950 [Bacteroidales bacterium]|nr:hypothetical protein [Bacteroidales bacterium]